MLSHYSEQSGTSNLDILLLEPLPPETRSRLIRCVLHAQESVLLPLEDLIEILSVEVAEVLPMPEMPDSVVGICTWRGEMLWLIDFNQFVGYPSVLRQEHPSPLTVLVIQSQDSTPGIRSSPDSLGVVVSQVQDIELHDLQRLQSAALNFFPPNLTPLVRGMLPESSDAVLDLKVLMQSLLWKEHPKKGR